MGSQHSHMNDNHYTNEQQPGTTNTNTENQYPNHQNNNQPSDTGDQEEQNDKNGNSSSQQSMTIGTPNLIQS